MDNTNKTDEIEKRSNQVWNLLSHFSISRIDRQAIHLKLMRLYTRDIEEYRKDIISNIIKVLNHNMSCCDCEDHMKWDRLLTATIKDLNKLK